MKTLILAALVITLGLASCSVTQPEESVYYPQQRVYTNPNYQYDPSYYPYDNRYSTQRVYDYNTGRYYDVPVYNSAPVYSTPVYQNRNYRRDTYRRDDRYRDNNVRRDYPREQPQTQTQPGYQQRADQPNVKRFPDGTVISPNGTVTLPNGEVKQPNEVHRRQ